MKPKKMKHEQDEDELDLVEILRLNDSEAPEKYCN